MKASGASAELRYGYRVVAQLGKWNLSESGDAMRVDAQTVAVDTFQLDQADKVSLHLHLGTRRWIWQDVEILDRGQPFSVRVHGSPETR